MRHRQGKAGPMPRSKKPKGWPLKEWQYQIPWLAKSERLRVVYGAVAHSWDPGFNMEFAGDPCLREVCGGLLEAMDLVAKGLRPDLADDETAAWAWVKRRGTEKGGGK